MLRADCTGYLFLALLIVTPAYAQLSIVGEWAGRYHEDQGDRVPGDVQGDFTGVSHQRRRPPLRGIL